MTDLTGCKSCIHYNPFKERTCKAFPKRIPSAIFTGKRKHQNVLKGQKGKFTFKGRPDPFTRKRDFVTILQFSKSSCIKCAHFSSEFILCEAFPAGIPVNILKGEDLHLEQVEGQKNEFIFTPKADSI